MKTNFTKEEILSHRGCYSREDVMRLSFINNDDITIQSILESEINIRDKRWFVWNNCDLSLDEKKKLCLKLAWVILPIYEEKYPGDPRVKDCLQATEDYNNGKITVKVLREKRAAVYASASAYAADYAVGYATVASAVGYADAGASYAADAADAKLTYSQLMQQCLIDFVK